MRTTLIVIAILLGAGGVAVAVSLKPSGFEQCVAIISADIERNASPGATLDPRDVEAEAARVCAGSVTS
jgi:hypothetical protein